MIYTYLNAFFETAFTGVNYFLTAFFWFCIAYGLKEIYANESSITLLLTEPASYTQELVKSVHEKLFIKYRYLQKHTKHANNPVDSPLFLSELILLNESEYYIVILKTMKK